MRRSEGEGVTMRDVVTEYQLATAHDASDLTDIVTVLLREGWELYGPSTVSQSGEGPDVYAQAMVVVVRYDDYD